MVLCVLSPGFRKKYEGRYSQTPTACFKGNYGQLRGNAAEKEKTVGIARSVTVEDIPEDGDNAK